ncbi:TAF6, C-terminal HEAT repeat domain containing protein [uncultured Caudovirales phage]|uniref:TAF6, C-terminal HEAT repeat domain containing protein n=1 Tax=uncultured Caudovirales phage TaxID=2100421 RepID=A0A6J5LFF4_9CAUD|nr:TAF6, C-terminal HEAT repeat domain containing protein [uncultured Caudovirales phage]
MARPSSLSESQLRSIEARLLAGEAMADLAREFGMSYNGLKKRVSATTEQTKEQIKSVANQLVSAQVALNELSISSQVLAINLAERLKSISEHLAGAAQYGAMTAHRLSGIANQKAQLIDDAEPSPDEITMISALTRVSNDASRMGLELLNSNKDLKSKPNKLNELSDDELIRIATGGN